MGTLNTASLILCIVFAYVAAFNGSNYIDLIEHISINCGSVESFSDGLHGNDWLEDDLYPKKLTTGSISLGGSSISSRTANTDIISVDPVPYKTARISHSTFSYRFQLDPGQKYIRLHFNPASYNGFQKFRDLFNVEANYFTLLSHFSPSITAKYLGVGTLVKEFCVTTQENQPLDIVFSRSDESSNDNYAFVNGIEIISIPAVSPYCHSGDAGVQVVGQKSVVYVDDDTALELVQRRDLIAGRTVFPFHRTWTKCSKEKENTWKISVDVGFRYLVKLHFAEFGLNNFTILINRVIVCTDVDIIQQSIEKGISWHKNHMVIVQGSKKEDHRDILISIYIKDGHMPLEGFEVFKLSNHDDNLASRSSLDLFRHSISQPSSSFASDTMKRTVALVVALFCLINIIVFAIRKICVPKNLAEEGKMQSTMDKHLCRCFSLAEIKSATNNFNDTLIIGRGGFGNVYKGLIDEEKETMVAIKRLRPDSRQGKREFWAEIKMLSALRHVNLVSLIGYCDEEGEMILVYEHMTRGTLASYLYKLDGKISIRYSLSWKERLLICIGAGRGLDYLHTGHRVMHRDVKSSNILLDENFVAKFSDFGLAKTQIGRDSQTQDSTNMKGTVGYIDPDYCRTHTMTRRSDIYSFGVVLLEVLCGRKAIDRTLEDDRRSLINWARENLIKGDVDTILDPRLRGQISPGSLKAFLNIAERCLDGAPKRRPRMAHVVMNLEFALKLQENVVHNGINDAVDIFPCVCKIPQETTRTVVPNERSSYGVLFSRKIFPSFLNVTAPQATTTGQLLISAPQNKNGKQFSKLKLLQFWPFDAFRNKAKSSKDFAAFSVSATASQRPGKEPASRFNRALGKFEQSAVIGNRGLLLSPDLKVFSFSELKKATSNFSEDTIIGKGGFGTVYKGWLLNGKYFSKGGNKSTTTIVAIKKLGSSSQQGLEQWQSELKHLGGLSHPNLIKLLGYCRKKKELLLVYEFMENGTLASHLFNSAAEKTLLWDMRLKILIGAARGLASLHGLETQIIHRDVKLANILLDESYNPKLSDFGLAKSGPAESNSHVSTRIMGTFGYVDPEYAKTGHLCVESDVFAFGVCVLETLTGLRVTHRNRTSGPRALSNWVNFHLSTKQRLNRVIIDPRLKGNYPTTAASQIAELALNCVALEPEDRPSMRQVVEILERVEAASDKSRQTKVTFVNLAERK